MAKTLELSFKNQEGKIAKISVDNPIEPVDPVAVAAAMDSIITANIFTSNGGEFVAKNSARVVDRSITDIKLS